MLIQDPSNVSKNSRVFGESPILQINPSFAGRGEPAKRQGTPTTAEVFTIFGLILQRGEVGNSLERDGMFTKHLMRQIKFNLGQTLGQNLCRDVLIKSMFFVGSLNPLFRILGVVCLFAWMVNLGQLSDL